MTTETSRAVVPELQLTPNEIRFYRDEGYLLIPGVIASAYVATIRDEVLEIMAANGAPIERLRRAGGKGDKLMQVGQYLAGSTTDRFVNSEALRSLASQLMEGRGSLYLPFTAVKAGGGGGTFHFHQDNQYTPFDGPGINLWCALDHMSPENGCLQVVPHSHLGGTLGSVLSGDGDSHRRVAKDPELFLPIRMNPGDCIAFSRLTLHGSGPNNSCEPRMAYAVQFHRDDVSATWDGESRLLKGSGRWSTAPVESLGGVAMASRDGH